ncbi:MAG: nucleotidyltransferase domain-containing protein [Candidatus Woesearchaeota archaeon]
MDMYQLKWTRLQSEMFRFLCIKAGQSFNLRNIAASLKVSPTAVSKALKGIEPLIKIKKVEKINLFSIELDRNNRKAIQLKRVENLKMVYESGLADFIFEEFPGCTTIVFGSYALGEDVGYGDKDERSSDIDIAIVGTKGKEINLKKYSLLLERKIHLNFYKSWADIPKQLKNNILQGIVLNGGVEL